MGKIKSTIPDNYVCDNYCEEICFECEYNMETANYSKRWRPKIETWFKKISKDAEEKIREYFKKKEKENKNKVHVPF